MGKPEPIYAVAKNPLIKAVTGGLYSFLSEDDALKVLEQLKEKFTTSRILQVQGSDNPNHAIFWIRGFSVTKPEKDAGFKGNYAVVYVDKSSLGKKFTLRAQKIESELKFHPERGYQKQTHPNWGFPILRRIKKKTEYKTIAEAAKELQRLQEEFPLACVPGTNKLYGMVYEKLDGKTKVQKYVFEIKALENGNFYVEYKRNAPEKKKQPPKKIAPVANNKPENEQSVGAFTAKIILSRQKKKKK